MYAEIDWRKVGGGLKIFNSTKSKICLASQIAEFLNQLLFQEKIAESTCFLACSGEVLVKYSHKCYGLVYWDGIDELM